ncbi:MAG: histidine kinase N-terminal 7TM domain-containing protein [Anaerolineaceae bacterium]
MAFTVSVSALLITLSGVLETITQILTAGVAITAIALLMYALGFNFNDKVARTFGIILTFVAIMFTCEIIANISNTPSIIQAWLQIKWVGLVMLPAAYFNFSDALLTLTGRPSRGRRKGLVRIAFVVSLVWVILIPFGITVGPLAAQQSPMPYLQRTAGTFVFGLYYLLAIGLAFYNLARAVLRSSTTTTRRRLTYLFVGASAPAITSIIFLFHGNTFFARNPDFFWIISTLGTIFTGISLIMMAYVVSFFGVTWTDRAIKSRLFRWLMRGPFVALIVLGMTTVVRRYGETLGDPYIAYVPIVMVGTILVLEYIITLLAPRLEKALFFGSDREDLDLIRTLQDRMLTQKDLDQFLEIIASSICDRLQVSGTFIAILEGNAVSYFIHTGDRSILENLPVTEELIQEVQKNDHPSQEFFSWGEYYLIPLDYQLDLDQSKLFGICGFPRHPDQEFDQEQMNAVKLLAGRATLALKDRALQTQVLNSLSALQPEVDYIQELRASSSYNQKGIYQNGAPQVPSEFTEWVKDALTHYWGGPKLTNNPLLELKVVQASSENHEGSQTNALRAVLKQAIDQTKPEGERKFTADWILYNILDLKFIQGKKVREVAHRLSVSEADLYRKQRIALENVAKNILAMEQNVVNSDIKPADKVE